MVVRWTKMIPAAALGAVAFTVISGGAVAFFPPVTGGSNTVKTVPPVPVIPTTPVVPPVNPPVPVVPKATVPCHPTVPPVTPSEVPEPATIVTGLLGMSLVGIAAMKKKLKGKTGDEPKPE